MRVLFAVDGSTHSGRAQRLLTRLFAGARHRVTVLNVTPPVLGSIDGGESITEVLKTSGERLVQAVARELHAQWKGVKPASVVLESAEAARSILDRAEKDRAGLIVLGARGLTPFKSFLLGSVSQKVSRHFPGSVLIARPGPDRNVPRLLVALDGSSAGRRVLDFLTGLGLPKETLVTLAHVVEGPADSWLVARTDPGFIAGAYETMLASQKKYHEKLRRAGAKVLSDAREKVGTFFPRARTALLSGHPAQEILRAAERADADLVVVGRRGLSKAERFLLGSVSHKVSSYAPCSVLLVK